MKPTALKTLLAATFLAGTSMFAFAQENPTLDQDPGNPAQERHWVTYDFDAGAYRIAEGVTDDVRSWSRANAAKAEEGTLVCFTAESEQFDWDVVLVNPSMRRAAEAHGVELLLLNNEYPSTSKPIENAETCVQRGADVVISFNVFSEIAPAIMNKYNEAKIPVVAVDVAHPGSVFYGADNCRTGELAGEFAVQWAKDNNWPLDQLQVIAGVDPAVGGAPACRNTGFIDAVKAALPDLPAGNYHNLDLRSGELGPLAGAIAATTDWMTANPGAKYIIATSINDDRAYGMAQAMTQAGRGDSKVDGIVIGKNGEKIALDAVRADNTPLVGSVSFFGERYGDDLVALALDVLAGKPVPSIVSVGHEVVSKANIDALYPAE
jgi:ribose transport system substrate-binding protein